VGQISRNLEKQWEFRTSHILVPPSMFFNRQKIKESAAAGFANYHYHWHGACENQPDDLDWPEDVYKLVHNVWVEHSRLESKTSV